MVFFNLVLYLIAQRLECDDTSRKRGESVSCRGGRSVVEEEEDVMMDLSVYRPGPEIHDLIGNFALQSDNSARYFMHKFPIPNSLILKKYTTKENF
jgi:hypothetical protein